MKTAAFVLAAGVLLVSVVEGVSPGGSECPYQVATSVAAAETTPPSTPQMPADDLASKATRLLKQLITSASQFAVMPSQPEGRSRNTAS